MDISPVCKILIPTLNYETLFGVRVLEKLGIHSVREVACMTVLKRQNPFPLLLVKLRNRAFGFWFISAFQYQVYHYQE